MARHTHTHTHTQASWAIGNGPLCTRICPYPFFEVTSPGATPGPPVKTGARVRRFRGCNNGFVCAALHHRRPSFGRLCRLVLFSLRRWRVFQASGCSATAQVVQSFCRLTHSSIPPLSTLTSRATHAHPTSPRSTGFSVPNSNTFPDGTEASAAG